MIYRARFYIEFMEVPLALAIIETGKKPAAVFH